MDLHRKYLHDEFQFFWRKLERNENFTLCRSADGEYAVMRGRHVTAQEGWQSPDSISPLGYALRDSLTIDDPRFFYGISCPCCDREAYYWYRTHTAGRNFTFSNIWVNVNYPLFRENFPALKRDTVLIANYRAARKQIGNLNILRHYPVSDDCIEFWEHDAQRLLAQIKKDFGDRKNLLFAVSAGPLSNPFIADLFRNNPDNCYIDFGSSLDGFYRDVKTRPYMIPGNTYAIRNCQIDDDPSFCLDVSVVLTSHKRPEMLRVQLDALEQQSLKPKEILLFQDGVTDGLPVRIPDEILKRFDKYEISPENVGVWGRFEFAERTASSPFICVFDDDTVPGNRWLENCHAEMMKREALYGAVGIMAQDTKSYPRGGYYRIGWPRDGHLPIAQEVDFVGHSWFFRKEWLKDLLSAPEFVRTMKRAAEDMSFSRQLQKRGIPTIVPPHPDNEPELYGSTQKIAYRIGNNEYGISASQENLERMNQAFKILLEDGWTLQVLQHPVSVFMLKIRLRITLNPMLKKLYRFGYETLRSTYRLGKRVLDLEEWKL